MESVIDVVRKEAGKRYDIDLFIIYICYCDFNLTCFIRISFFGNFFLSQRIVTVYKDFRYAIPWEEVQDPVWEHY